VSKATSRPTSAPAAISIPQFLALEAFDRELSLDVEGERVRISNPGRVYWPAEGITKGRLAQYYAQVAPAMLPFLAGRPAILKRYPSGISQPPFFQHNVENAPSFLTVQRLNHADDVSNHAVYTGLASLLYLTNLGNIEQHPWQSRVEHVDYPDLLVIDLDPYGSTWDTTVEVALATRDALHRIGLVPFVKTSGGKGLHLYAPLEPVTSHERVHAVAEAVCRFVAEQLPDKATPERSIKARKHGQVYMDWVQNGWGKSLAAAYSVRARAGAPVSCPLTWQELEQGAQIQDFTLHTVPTRLASRNNPWQDLFTHRRKLPEA